jgi:DNA polymerase III subunit delta'
MAKRARDEEIIETDRIAGIAHPRETFELKGHDEGLARAARIIRSGRAPHAWLLGGPPGIGKATFAYRLARYLLRFGATAEGPADLAVAANDPVSLQVRAGSHPGLLVLKRGIADSGKPMTVLGIDEVRRLAGFFGLSSGAGGWRIAIVDTADDMNDAAANALLKVLEEPPRRAMLILIADSPARLMPTIRSRCQLLALRPLSDDALAADLVERLPQLSADDRDRLVLMAGGSIGAALRLAHSDGLKLAADAERLIERASEPDFASTLALAERVARLDRGLESFGDYLGQSLAARILARARRGETNAERSVALWARLSESFARSAGLHLDPRQTIVSAARALSVVARRNPI